MLAIRSYQMHTFSASVQSDSQQYNDNGYYRVVAVNYPFYNHFSRSNRPFEHRCGRYLNKILSTRRGGSEIPTTIVRPALKGII